MAELPTERLTVFDTPLGFRGWLSAFGDEAVDVRSPEGGRQKWYYYGQPILRDIVILEFDTDPERLEVTATLVSGIDNTKGGKGRTFDGDAVELAAFHKLCEAIREKYALAGPIPPTPIQFPAPTGRQGKYSPGDWDKLFEQIPRPGTQPDYHYIARKVGCESDYVSRKWREYLKKSQIRSSTENCT